MSKLLLTARLAAALPLLAIGTQHLIGSAPLLPILEGAGVPFPELGALVTPPVQVLVGALLLVGAFPRLAALAVYPLMAGALFAHLRFDWADEPPIALPIASMAFATLVLLRGAGSLALHPTRRVRHEAEAAAPVASS